MLMQTVIAVHSNWWGGQSLRLGVERPESSSYFILSGSVILDKSVNLAVSL